MRKTVQRRGTGDTAAAIRHTANLICNSQEYAELPVRSQEFLNSQLYGPGRITSQTPSSALPARLLSAQVFQSVAQLHFNDLFGRNPEPYLATFSFRNGEVGVGHRLRNVQTSIFKAKAALANFGLDGVIMPDIDILLPSPNEDPILALHLHALVVSTGSKKVWLRRTAERMSELIGWESRLPKPVTLRGKQPGDLRIHAENISTYTGKFTAAPKVPYLINGEVKWKRDRSANSATLGIGALYAWSQIPLPQSVYPVGDFGERFHATWLSRIRRARNVGTQPLTHSTAVISNYWQEIVDRIWP